MSSLRMRDLALALSLANLSFFDAWHNLVYADKFFMPTWTWVDFVALFLNVLLFTLLYFFLLGIGRRFPHRPALAFHRWLPLISVAAFLQLLFHYYESQLDEIPITRETVLLGAVIVLAAAAVMRRWHRPVLNATELFALWLLAFVPVTSAQAAWQLWKQPAREVRRQQSGLAAPPASSVNRPRLVWLVFDELDGRTAFHQRPPGLQLPEFDRLCADSLCASNAFQAGTTTMQAMTSMIVGKQTFKLQPSGPDEVLVSFQPDKPPNIPLSSQPNLFARARAAGVTTAVVGWFFPYCRVFGSALTQCVWQAAGAFSPEARPSILEAMAHQLYGLSPLQKRFEHREEHRIQVERACRAAADQSLGLVLVHLNVPHRPPIYDRRTGDYTLFSIRRDWYLDNLVLADLTLGEVRRAMEAAGVWKDTTVLVTADHALRWYVDFNTETDAHIPFLFKPAGDSPGLNYQTPFNAIATSELILAVLRGEVTDAASGARWLDQHAPRPPTLIYR
ncbi:MAG TPA: sulfatase-like hydrolase/transferase [Terriglobales bacterium]|nr:sulfatase-like hydrolase/transferase [Terriglobales bacterium]